MRLPVTSYRHDYNRDRRGNNTGVKSHFLPPIPGWKVKTCHYIHHTAHCFATDHPRERIRQGPYPMISGTRPYPPVLDPASTQPRPTIGQQGGKTDLAQDSRSFHRLVPYVTMVSGMAGHSWGTSLQPPLQGSTKLHLKTPPASRPPLTL
jgi:hypothetical protein